MIKDFCLAWEENKDKLEDHFRTTIQEEYDDYKDLIVLLFNKVINPYLESKDKAIYDTDDIDCIDHGSYHGTLVFVLHKECYSPYLEEYIYTNTYYGSCSGCDILQSIHSYDYDELPNEEQIKDYMQLCLHLLQRCNGMRDVIEEYEDVKED